MRIVFFASHLLHWRSLIPVAVELAHRGHSITVQVNRPNWMGMPTFQMNWRPTQVTGVNRASLAWVAEKIGYGKEWATAQNAIESVQWLVPEEYDCAVSTTKDMTHLQDLTEEINSYRTAYAVGYQHFPVIMRVGAYRTPWQYMPKPFWYEESFAKFHGFEKIMAQGRGRTCGFPHLDRVQITHSYKQNAVLIQHHGGYRGIRGHGWLAELVRTIGEFGYLVYICPHFIPGFGYGSDALHHLRHSMPWEQASHFRIVDRWWDVAGMCDLILTTGSSAAYEMWSVGLTNVFIIGYVGGVRQEKFTLFEDLMVESPEALRTLLKGLPGSAQAKEPLTQEVMAAYRSVHNGQGAKTAADVIEGG